MRHWLTGGLGLALAAGLLVGCSSTSSSRGVSSVAITDESLQTIAGNLCAVRGHATNVGNLTANVTIQYEALSATGVVIGTSSASFQIAPFSSFDFTNAKGNQNGQPSSGAFSNGLACAGIAGFKRTSLGVSDA